LSVQLLLDTHVFLWLLAEPGRLGEHIGSVEDPSNELFLSAASPWEIAVKTQLGRFHLPEDPRRYVPDRMRAIGTEPLPIEHNHALAVGELPLLRRDPFARILVAQARGIRMTILTADANIARYEVENLLV
jgi:PIN domain nuclease of toxin-antitoxin system